ncbi:MAG: ATPase [Clostridium sp.]
MEKNQVDIIELLEYLQEIMESASKVPISGKSMVDREEILEIIDQIRNSLPDQLVKAQWIVGESNRILGEAKKERDSIKKDSLELMRQNVENHDVVKEAKIRAQEILNNAKRDAKAIRLGSRDYSNEILTQLDAEIEAKKAELIKSLQTSFESAAREIDSNLTEACSTVKENIKELRGMKK